MQFGNSFAFYIKIAQVAKLEVVVPPEISDKFSTKDISVSEGGQAKFFCSATGNPTPTITWRRNPDNDHRKGLYKPCPI